MLTRELTQIIFKCSIPGFLKNSYEEELSQRREGAENTEEDKNAPATYFFMICMNCSGVTTGI